MSKAVVVGALGYAGQKHCQVLAELGFKVVKVDIRGIDGARPPSELPRLLEDADLAVFTCTPKAREEYMEILYSRLRGKLVVLEKPPVRPIRWHLAAWYHDIDWVPVHNYLFMPSVRKAMEAGRIEVVILRPGPHKGWYTSIEDAGGGVLLDHGYHWLYVSAALRGLTLRTAWIDTFPETEAAFVTNAVKFYATWRSPFRATFLNGRAFEPRSDEMIVSLREYYKAVLENEKTRRELRWQAVWALSTIADIYDKSGLPWRGRVAVEDEPRG